MEAEENGKEEGKPVDIVLLAGDDLSRGDGESKSPQAGLPDGIGKCIDRPGQRQAPHSIPLFKSEVVIRMVSCNLVRLLVKTA